MRVFRLLGDQDRGWASEVFDFFCWGHDGGAEEGEARCAARVGAR